MGTKISMAEKEMMAKVLEKDLALIQSEIHKQFSKIWEETKKSLEHELGFDDTNDKIGQLHKQIAELQNKISNLQNSMSGYGHSPELKDYIEAGIVPPDNRNGYIYSHNKTYMGMSLATKLDLLTVKKLKERLDPERPVEVLGEIAEAAFRGLVMAGTFEEARANYDTFYSLDFQKYGVKIPRKLTEIKKIEGQTLLSASIVAMPALPAPEETDRSKADPVPRRKRKKADGEAAEEPTQEESEITRQT